MNYQAVLAGLPDAVIAVDAEQRVVFWNAAAEELIGRSARRAEGRLLKDVLPPRASVTSRLAETLSAGESRSETDRKSTRLNSSHIQKSRMPSSA